MAQTHQWHSGTGRLNARLISCPPLLPDELLSSWLVRLALANGFHPLTLTDFIWPRWRVWMLDIDRGIDAEHERKAVEFLGASSSIWQAATLRNIAARVSGGSLPRIGIWPWILAIGARNGRRSGGLQYCPQCLATDSLPYFRLQWRLAWHTVCEIHHVYLQDGCPICHSPLEPHRLGPEFDHPAMCAQCLADFTMVSAGEYVNPESLRFQNCADQAIVGGEAMFQGHYLDGKDWFAAASFFTALVHREQRGDSKSLTRLLSLLDAVSPQVPIRVGAGIEKLRLQERAALLSGVAKLMSCDGQRFADALLSCGASQRTLALLGRPIPECLSELIESLPRQQVRHRGKGTSRARHHLPNEVKRMMISLERRVMKIEPRKG